MAIRYLIPENGIFRRKQGGGYMRPIFSNERLIELTRLILQSGKPPDGVPYGLAGVVLGQTFGRKWLEKHVFSEPTGGYFARSLGKQHGSAEVMNRVVALAELIVNLGRTKGVEAPLEQLAGGKIESGCTELEVGGLLAWAGINFRYIWANGQRGESFDIELRLPNGITACGDIKSKSELSEFSASSFNSVLSSARKQLPPDYPGMIFVQLPQSWQEANVNHEVATVISNFFRNTKRIVSVQTFTSYSLFTESNHLTFRRGREFRNEKHKFSEQAADWRLLSSPVGDLLLTPPASWVSFANLSDWLLQ